MLMMGELIAFFKSVIIILLKLVLLFLKKRHSKEQNLSENDTTNDSGFGSHSPSSREDEAFDLSSELDAEIGRLRTENKALRDIMSKEHHGPRSDFNRNAVKSLCSRRGTSLTDMSHHVDFVTSTPRSPAPDVAVHDVVCQKLMLKLQLEREENDRLQNYINDIMYMVLENRQSLLEK
ncbi:uncharacterized protein LOC124136340 [Haliotis rufescens]|uniref:uncharacterized protein LOC124136340 n=1 Tax=Haliotis rufescens TaxID=6454 RepID=UPI00201F82C3|nr:uncharacterized protein LOC124136340 [Haliotis rufescens]